MGLVVVVDFGRIAREAVDMSLWTAGKQQSGVTSKSFVIICLRCSSDNKLRFNFADTHRHGVLIKFRYFDAIEFTFGCKVIGH